MLNPEAIASPPLQLNPLLSGRIPPRNTPERPRSEARLKADIDRLKDPNPYKEKYGTEEIQHLAQAIDILGRLQASSLNVTSMVGYDKVRNARAYLDTLLKHHLEKED